MKDSVMDKALFALVCVSVLICFFTLLVVQSDCSKVKKEWGSMDEKVSCSIIFDDDINDCSYSYPLPRIEEKEATLVYCELGRIYYCLVPEKKANK